MAQRMLKNPESGASRVGMVSAIRKQEQCMWCHGEKHTLLTPVHTDHIESKDAGGLDHINNYVLSCVTCNTSKSNYKLCSWMRRKHPSLFEHNG